MVNELTSDEPSRHLDEKHTESLSHHYGLLLAPASALLSEEAKLWGYYRVNNMVRATSENWLTLCCVNAVLYALHYIRPKLYVP